MTDIFMAYYEDRAKTSAACDDDESYTEFANQPENHTKQKFPDLASAEAWVKRCVENELTVFGCGEIREFDLVPKGARCRYCTCNGWRLARRHIVEDDGIVESFENENECCD